MAKFLTGDSLEKAIIDVFSNASKRLLIVSPYIKLDNYFRDLFDTHISKSNLHIIIVFGKNEKDPKRSFSEEDFEFFKKFPFVSVIYVPKLHAKYYANESKGVITSINMYDYSFDNNTEFGVSCETNIVGDDLHKDAWKETIEVIEKNEAVFVRRPRQKKRLLVFKDYAGSRNDFDQTDKLLRGEALDKMRLYEIDTDEAINVEDDDPMLSREEYKNQHQDEQPDKRNLKKKPSSSNLVSATALGKPLSKSYQEVKAVVESKGYVENDKITQKGISAGLELKKSNDGNEYIVYPENLREIL